MVEFFYRVKKLEEAPVVLISAGSRGAPKRPDLSPRALAVDARCMQHASSHLRTKKHTETLLLCFVNSCAFKNNNNINENNTLSSCRRRYNGKTEEKKMAQKKRNETEMSAFSSVVSMATPQRGDEKEGVERPCRASGGGTGHF